MLSSGVSGISEISFLETGLVAKYHDSLEIRYVASSCGFVFLLAAIGVRFKRIELWYFSVSASVPIYIYFLWKIWPEFSPSGLFLFNALVGFLVLCGHLYFMMKCKSQFEVNEKDL